MNNLPNLRPARFETLPLILDRSKSLGRAGLLIPALLLCLATSQAPAADTLTWDASGANPTTPTDGAGNWSTSDVRWSNGSIDSVWTNGDNAIFGSGGAGGAITIGSGVVVGNILVRTNYTLSSNPLTLSNSPTLTVEGSGTTATISSTLAGTGFTKEGAGTLLVNEGSDNTYSGAAIVNNGTLRPGSTGGRLYISGNLIVNTNGTFNAVSGSPGSGVFGNGVLILNGANVNGNVFVNSGTWISAGTCVLANGAIITNGGGTVSGTYGVTNSDARSGAVWLTRHGFGIFNTIAKSTAGSVIISTRPNAQATDGYIATLNAGALIFDYAYAANAAVKLKTGSPLTFQGGMLVFSNGSSGLNPSANNPGAGGTFFNSGASSILSTNAGSSGGNLTMGAISRRTGATFNLVRPGGPGSIGSSTANVNGIVGGWNTFNLTDWTSGTTTWAALASGSYTTTTDPTTWIAANNVSLGGNPSANLDDVTINTLRLTNTATVTINSGKTLTLSSGGLLITGSGATAITGGTLLGASGADLIVHQYASADLTISSALTNNGASPTSLTKDGTGKLIINGSNDMTGTNYLNGGAVEVSSLSLLASGPLDMNGGTLRYTGSDTTSSRAVTTRGLGPIFDVVGGTTVTQSGAITGSGDALGDFGGLTKIGAGTLVLTANNNFNGETVVSNGVLAINGTNNYNAAVWDAGKVSVYAGGRLGGTGMISGAVVIKNGGTLSPGNSIGTLTLATNLSLENGSTNLFEVTNGSSWDLLQVQGNLVIGANSRIAVSVLGGALDAATNTIITYTGTKTGSFNPVVSFSGSLNCSLVVDESTPGVIKLVASPNVAIVQQPADTVANTNDAVSIPTLSVGQAPLSYQWYFYGANPNNPASLLDGQTNSALTIASADGTNSGYYRIVVANGFNSVTSSPAALIVGNNCPMITSSPLSITVIQGNNASFSITTILGNPPPTYQWQTNGVAVTGATATSLTLSNVQYAALNNAVVSVIVSNVACVQTNTATLTVIVPPVISPQPTNITVNVGDSVTLTSGASGVPAPGLQWFKNNLAIPDETNATLTFASAQGSDNGVYKLVATNSAGTATSSNATLTVNSTTLAPTAFAPANSATGIGYDTPLYVTFNGTVSTVNVGKIRIFNANSATPVDVIDLTTNIVVISGGINVTNNVQAHSPFAGDAAQQVRYFPVIANGNVAAIYPHAGVMTSNQTYYVTIENGVVKDSSGAYYAGLNDTNAWRFTTKVGGPVSTNSLVVAADGSGDFVTVQGAIDSIPLNNTNFVLISIRDGIYTELVNISAKNNLTFRGQSRTGTVVGYGNNDNINTGTAPRSAFKVNSSDIKLDNLTISNSTPQGGSQAEALLVYNAGLRCVVNNCDIVSRQDTILINATVSQGYFNNCRIVGNFDYVWGSGVGFFTNCTIHTITNILSGTYNLTAARTGTSTALSTNTPWINPNGTTYSANGFSFVSCTLDAEPGLNNVTLAGNNGTAGGLDSWANCLIDPNAYRNPAQTLTNLYLFWQYNNMDLTGTNANSYANLVTIGVTNNDPRLLAALNVQTWFYGWLPQLPNTAPTLTPVSDQTVNVGVTVTVTNVATDADVPAQTLTFSLLTGPTNATVGASSGIFTFRPLVSQADSTNAFAVAVTDNGTPNLSATNAFTVVVNPLPLPDISAPTYSGGQFSLIVSGQTGPDYAVQTSTNLESGIWVTLFATNSPSMPFSFVDTNSTAPAQFYRVIVGPPLP